MRGKQRAAGHHMAGVVGRAEDSDDEYKRPPTPVMDTGAGGPVVGPPFWPAPPPPPHHAMAETGFINSQPSMAEFMTHLGAAAADIGTSGPPQPPQPPSPTPPASAAAYQAMVVDHQQAAGVNVPEYPWMKEKKTARKSNQQGRQPNQPSAEMSSPVHVPI